MKSLPKVLLLCLVCGVTGQAQTDPFHGTWRGIEEKSKRVTDNPVTEELITLIVENNTEHNMSQMTRVSGPPTRGEYKVTYNDGKWAPMINRDTGKETGGTTMVLRLEPRRELRIIRNAKGETTAMVLRTVQPDGKMMTIYTIQMDGSVSADLWLEKIK
jgi:hypothetical protein